MQQMIPTRWASAPFLFLPALVLLTGCQSLYYGTLEKFGYEKRDLLVSRVEKARTAQEEAKTQFKSALAQFMSVVKVDAGQLQDTYEKLKGELERSETKAADVHDRIAKVEEVAEALFSEWKSELKQYSNDSLRAASQRKLDLTRRRYAQYIDAMKRAEGKIEPVLKAFRDQVLFLKHNLNAEAVASLRTEMSTVEANTSALIKDMEASIAEANTFLGAMANEDKGTP